MYVWNVKFVYETNRDHPRMINTVAESFTDAYVKAQNALPGAEITALNKVGKIADPYAPNWVDVVAKYFAKNGTAEEIKEFTRLCSEQMREELTAKIWDLHHNGRTN